MQECVPENLDLKRQILKQIDRILDPENTETVIASSTSSQLPSALSEGMHHASQIIVAHPVLNLKLDIARLIYHCTHLAYI